MHFFKKTIAAVLCSGTLFGTAVAQDGGSPGVDKLKSVIEATRSGKMDGLTPKEQAAIQSGLRSGAVAAKIEASPAVLDTVINQAVTVEDLAREAYVASLPPRDRARAQNIMLNNYNVPGTGTIYYFVSRSMPVSVLRAYALDALYTGGTLVVKGVRKGDTIKDYIEEVVAEFNKADGQVLAGLEINPNLYDMFGVTVVPTIVWTNRSGLDDMGSGCQRPNEGEAPNIELEGPDGEPLFVEKPMCNLLPDNAFYKISGVVNTNYALDRFEAAGADKVSITKIRADLGRFRSNVNQGAAQEVGSAITPIESELGIDTMPPHVLLDWKESLSTRKVMRTAWGPAFSSEGEDDPVYRKELLDIIDRGLGQSSP